MEYRYSRNMWERYMLEEWDNLSLRNHHHMFRILSRQCHRQLPSKLPRSLYVKDRRNQECRKVVVI
jgi:hypothetical protein